MMTYKSLLILTVALSTFSVFLVNVTADDTESDELFPPLYWKSYLIYRGGEIGCQFTLEHLYRPADEPDDLFRLFIEDDPKIDSVDALLAKLQKEVKALHFVKNPKHSNLIHVIDRRLLKLEGYPVTKKYSIAFRGTPAGFTGALHTHTQGSVTGKMMGDLREVFNDDLTKISVTAKNGVLRDILTDCVPLDGYHTFVWRAETSIVDGSAVTTVQFYGPRKND